MMELKLKILKQSSKSGFTVVESIIGLLIAAMILGLTVTMISGIRQNRIQEKAFFDEYERCFRKAQNSSLLMHRKTQITVEDGHLKFIDYGDEARNFTLNVPETIHLANSKTIYITDAGFVSPQTIQWLNQDGNVKYKQKIQLGWGGFVVEKEE
ncbi:type II secretion system protein [Lentilactobacillus curieae]|nr:type II secretion system protein [Lentilactobacillus curieae]